MKRTVRSAFVFAAAFIVASLAIAACGELTGPESPSTPTDVVATLASATSATVTWTPSPLNDGVISYSIFRNGTKVGESTTTSFTDTGLAQQTTYVYSVAANCKGGIVSDRSAETTQSTVTTVDITPPRVLSTIPLNGATGVSRAGTATVTFSEPMDPTTINASTFNIRITSSGQILAGTVTYNATTRVAEFVPSAPLPNSTNVTVTVTAGAKDLAGNALSPVFIASWTTRDEDGPTVILVSPANGATGVAPGAAITVTFSESVQASTVNTTNISLKLTSSGAVVAGTLAFNGTNIATFTPSAPLAQGNYTLTVNNVKDLGGNSMPAPFVSTFTVDTTPPTVTAVSPTNAATGVATNTTVQVTFSELMDVNTINNTTILLRNTVTTALVPAAVTYNSTTNIATLTPTGPLSNATNYTVVVTTGVKDAAGNALAAQFQSTFTTAALADTTAPTIISRSPVNAATNVATNTDVTITFSEQMDVATINSTNITLKPTAGGANISATVTCNSPCTTATLDPAAPLLNNTNYTVTVTTGVKDVAGNALAAQSTSTFTTIADTTAPTILSTSPVNGTTVPAPATITVVFSEDMDPLTINGTTFTVKKTSDSSPVAGTVSYNAATKTAIFTPTGPGLANGTGYTVTVTTGAKDLAGNGLTGNFTFSFTTSTPGP